MRLFRERLLARLVEKHAISQDLQGAQARSESGTELRNDASVGMASENGRPHPGPGDTRVSSVQYLTFEVGTQAPFGVGCDHPDPELHHQTTLSPEQRAALQADLDA
jgi:hypothetical protein